MIGIALCLPACGKKGPPLPPLVKLPVAPGDLTAARRADTIDLQFTVPNANTDNTRPANVARVDVYALTGPAAMSEADVLDRGTRIASVPVKAPRDPEATFDPNDPDQSEADVDPPEGEGLDQGAVARVRDTLAVAPTPGGSPATTDVRTYVGVAITTRGRRGPSSRRAIVPLGSPPPAPQSAAVTYTESAVTVTWSPPLEESEMLVYNVYEAAAASAEGTAVEPPSPEGFGAPRKPDATQDLKPAATQTEEIQLTTSPIAATQYVDSRIAWGATRCYAVRTVETVDALSVESEATRPPCVTLVDTFPPAAPKAPRAVAIEGVINLIWDANTEADLGGYILLRGAAPGDELMPITPMPIRETAFQDRVPSGVRYVYALQAVDRAGNTSPMSERTEETAR